MADTETQLNIYTLETGKTAVVKTVNADDRSHQGTMRAGRRSGMDPHRLCAARASQERGGSRHRRDSRKLIFRHPDVTKLIHSSSIQRVTKLLCARVCSGLPLQSPFG